MIKKTFILVLLLSVLSFLASAAPIDKAAIPDALKPWQGWVLHGQEQRLQCIPDFSSADTYNCTWPSALILDFLATDGSFRQEWTVHAKDSWIQLPGEKRFWPESVTINGSPALVIEREGLPFILAPQGRLLVEGRFHWQAMPESFQVPPATALVSASVDNTPMDSVIIDSAGRLWLRPLAQGAEQKSEDSLDLHVFRRIDDMIPPQVDIHLDIQAAGSQREINLGSLFPMETFVPLTLSASLPAKLEQNGDLLLQLRPGQWVVDLSLRHKGPLPELAFIFPGSPHWPKSEVWSFQDQPSFRVVKIEGAPPAIDPSQTTVPAAWRTLPAYLVESGQKLLFKEIKRGQPDPPPDQLKLSRDLWLDFDGKGYFVRDAITGTKHNNWRFSTMGDRLQLGRVTLDGRDQLITTLGDGKSIGVEIRQGNIGMTTVSTIAQPVSQIPATGYDTTFQSVTIALHLPPGFSLFNLTGVDNVHGTWIGAWTLLDLFLLFISTIACFKVIGRLPALVCFVTLVLLYHQPQAPLWGWLNIIGAVAILGVMPEGRFKKLIQMYKNASILMVVIVSLPFMVSQIRHGLYPQLERPYQEMAPAALAPAAAPGQNAEEVMSLDAQSSVTAYKAAAPEEKREGAGAPEPMMARRAAPVPPKKLEPVDPDAKIQTGPGLPTWQWNRIDIAFNGPVTKDQNLHITVLSPTVNLILAVSRCLAILLFLGAITGVRPSRRTIGRVASVFFLVFLPVFEPSFGQAGEIPSPELLQELQQRLLEPAPCFPDCVAVDSLTIRQDGERLVFSLDVSAYEKTAMPLPGYLQQWQPEKVWFPFEKDRAPDLLRKQDVLWAVVEAGKSIIEIIPRFGPDLNSLQINLPLIPHRLKTDLTDWTLSGVDSANTIPGSLTLTRMTSAEKEAEQGVELRMGALPPFFSVERTLNFGLTWQVETTVRRLTPADSAMVVLLPLVKGEAVLTDGIAVKEGLAELIFSQQTEIIQFSSNLETARELTLSHAQTDLYSETWRIEPSSIWHIEYQGPPVISHQEANRWLPTWKPWPGESVTLTITRPKAVAGPVKTIDTSRLAVEPGRTAANVSLSMTMRASQGGQHSITIPSAAEAIRKFMINGRSYPIQKDAADRLVFPVTPGQQEITIEWTEKTPIAFNYATPTVDLGLPSVNSHLTMAIGQDRWPLVLWGPRMGPAVLWWSFVVITFLASFGLARLRMVPLKLHQWFLLGIGMLQTNIFLPVVFTLWLVALGKRRDLPPDLKPGTFNFIQFCLAVLTFAAISSLVAAISNGLLGYPDMQIIGNGSYNFLFQWYQDIAATVLPRGHVISLPLWIYRVLMLVWALWISFTLVRLLTWGWQCFSSGRIWVSTPIRFTREKREADQSKTDPRSR